MFQLKAEFGRILTDKTVVRDAAESLKALEGKILKVASNSPNKKVAALLSEKDEEDSEEPNNKAGKTTFIAIAVCIDENKFYTELH